jgi:integrase
MLTVSSIKGLKSKDKPYYTWDTDGQRGRGKLGVQVTPKGSKRFVFRYFIDRKANFIPIGQFPEYSLADARERQKELGKLLLQGINPQEFLTKEKEDKALAELQASLTGSLEQLINGHVAKMKREGKRTGDLILKRVEVDVYNVIPKEKKARDITPNDIKLVLAKMIQRGAAAHSNKIRAYLHAAFNYGLKHDNDPVNLNTNTLFGMKFNPVTPVPKQTYADKVGENWLTIRETWDLLQEKNSAHFKGDLFILLQLCFHLGGQRPFEIMSNTWSAVDFEERTFNIRAGVSKTEHPNLIPLTDTAYELFEQLRIIHNDSGSDFLFPRNTKTGHLDPVLFSKTVRKFCLNTGFRKFEPRDIRRTVKTLTGEIGLSKDIRDRIQNHSLNDVSTKHYDRYQYLPEKRRALEAWEQRLNGADIDNNVVTFAGRR